MIPTEKILPSVLVIIDIGAALAYIPTGDWRHVVYWFAAAVLTYVVTW